jgi:hypothetical protein
MGVDKWLWTARLLGTSARPSCVASGVNDGGQPRTTATWTVPRWLEVTSAPTSQA